MLVIFILIYEKSHFLGIYIIRKLTIMKKLIINESQLKKIVSENTQNVDKKYRKTFEGETLSTISMDSIPKLLETPLLTGAPTLSNFSNIVRSIIKATRIIGTEEEDVKNALLLCKNMHDVKGLFKAYEDQMGENMMVLFRGEFSTGSDVKNYLYEPIKRSYDASWNLGHFQKEVVDESLFLKLFPCITTTPGYDFQQVKDGVFYFFANNNGTDSMYALRKDGTLSIRQGGKYIPFKNKTKCNVAMNESKILKEEGLSLNPDANVSDPVGAGETKKVETPVGTGETKKVETPEKPKVVTKLMTGSDVEEIQTILHKQGFGDIVGSIDGKLGTKTLAGIKKLFLGATRPKIEAITVLEPKGIKPIETKIPKIEPSPLAEEIQKNFNRFL